MATNLHPSSLFNPEQADKELTFYGGLTKPISDPKAYSASAEAVKDAGNIFGDVVKVSHTLIQQDLDNQIHEGIDRIRDPYTTQLNAALDEVKNGPQQQAGGTVTRTDVNGNPIGPRGSLDILSTASQGTMPKALEDLTPNLTALEGARANKKLSKTDYDARLDALAKDFRKDFPGWREYIDKKFESITGENPANAVIRSRIQDINSWVTATKTEKDKVLAVAMREDNLKLPDMPEQIELFKATGNTNALLTHINKQLAFKHAAEVAAAKLSETEGTVKDKQLQATVLGNKIASNIVDTHIDTLLKSVGIDTDPAKAEASFTNMEPAVAQNLAQNMRYKMTVMDAQIRQELATPIPGDPNKNSRAFYMGPEAVNSTVAAVLRRPQTLVDYLSAKEGGLAYHTARIIQANQDSTAQRVYGTKDLGETLREAKVIEGAVGSQALSTLMPKFISSGLPTQYDAYVTSRRISAATGSDYNPETGQLTTLRDDVLQVKKNVEADTNIPLATKPKLIAQINQRFIDQIKDIADPGTPDEVRRSYARRAFSPEGQGLIAQLERDGIGLNGKKGKFSVYNELYSEKMTSTMKALGGEEWQMYKDTAQSNWSNELLRPELRELNKVITNDPNTEIQWNDKAHRFGAVFSPAHGKNAIREAYGIANPGSPTLEVNKFTQDRIGDGVRRINDTLAKYATIAKADGADEAGVNAYVLKTLHQMLGQNPENPTAAAFFMAVRAAHESNKPQEAPKSKPAAKKAADIAPDERGLQPGAAKLNPLDVKSILNAVGVEEGSHLPEVSIPEAVPMTPAERYEAIKRRRSKLSPEMEREVQSGRIPLR